MARALLYNDGFPDILYEHLKNGYSFEAFGAIAKVSKQTLYNWITQFPDFKDAKERGEMASLYWWESQGRDGLKLGKDFNATTWIFNMKNRFHWRDKTTEELKDEQPKVKIFALPSEEKANVIKLAREAKRASDRTK